MKRVRRKKGGKIKNATSLEYKGLTFKSKLELFTYMKLLEAGINDFKYEQEKFTLMQPFEFNCDSIEMYERAVKGTDGRIKLYGPVTNNIRGITYLPDFTCIKEDKTGYVIEVKGYNNDVFPVKWKFFKDYLLRNGYNLTLYKPNNQGNVLKTIEMIKEKYYGNT